MNPNNVQVTTTEASSTTANYEYNVFSSNLIWESAPKSSASVVTISLSIISYVSQCYTKCNAFVIHMPSTIFFFRAKASLPTQITLETLGASVITSTVGYGTAGDTSVS